MAERSIVWSPTARNLFRSVLDYWNRRNGSTAYSKKLLTHTDQALRLAARFPEIGIQTSFNEIRILVLGHFNIYYKAEDDRIKVYLFWDNRQDPQRLAEQLERMNRSQ